MKRHHTFGLPATGLACCLLLMMSINSAIAAGLGGSWNGRVTQSNTHQTYRVEMYLYGSVGNINYPSLDCGGQLQFMRKAGSSYLYSEHITYGNCIDGGTVTIAPTADSNSWYWRWVGSGITVEGYLSGSGAEAP